MQKEINVSSKSVKLVCFDLDDTLLLQNSWVKLNIGLGVTEKEDQHYYEQYHQGIITYDEWQQTLLSLYKRQGPVPRSKIEAILQDYRLHPDAAIVTKNLQERGYTLALISGSFDILVNTIARHLSIKLCSGNTHFIFDEEDNLQTLVHKGDEANAKLESLKRWLTLLV